MLCLFAANCSCTCCATCKPSLCLLFLQSALRNFRPLLDRVLVQRLAPETVSGQFMAGSHVAMATDLLENEPKQSFCIAQMLPLFGLHLAANSFSLHVKFSS